MEKGNRRREAEREKEDRKREERDIERREREGREGREGREERDRERRERRESRDSGMHLPVRRTWHLPLPTCRDQRTLYPSSHRREKGRERREETAKEREWMG